MEYPVLVPGRRYRIVFQHERSSDVDHATPWAERAMEDNNCVFLGLVGDWWGFIGTDGIQHRIVNPDSISYIETHNPEGTESEDFGNYSSAQDLPTGLPVDPL